jgi:dipeptidyl aminopeptidase/acylaminoacyl peptidase
MKLLLALALGLGGFLGLSLVAFWLAVRPPRLSVPLRPEDYRLPAEEVAVTTADGLTLSAWLIPRPGAAGVILLHGYPADRADMLPIAAALGPRFTTLLLDMRYFGRSEGRVTTLGDRERSDLRRAIDVLEARGVPRIGVFGFSLGGAVALMTAGEEPRIRAVAAYAPFADLAMLGRDLYGWLGPLRYPFVGLMTAWSRILLGHDITALSPVAAAPRLLVPVLLIASRADEQIPFSHAERLRAALRDNPRAEFMFLERGRHGELPADFGARLSAFFERALR